MGYERFSRWPPKWPLHLRLSAFLLFIKLSPKFEYGISPVSLHLCTHQLSHLSLDFFLISYKLWLKFEYGFCLMNDNRDGQQNDRRLLVCTCGNSNFVIYYPISSKFQIQITSSIRCPQWDMGFVQFITKMAAKMDIPFSLQGIMQIPLSESDCSKFQH